MRKMTLSMFAAASVALTPLPAHAAEQILDFTQGNFCNGGKLCTNNAAIDQNYGSTNEVTVTYGSFYDNYPTGGMYYYERGFGDLVGNIYGNKGSVDFRTTSRIVLSAKEGFEIALKSFDLGCFANISNCQAASYNVLPGGGEYLSGGVSTGYPTHKTVSFNAGYGNVSVISFGYGENVGIDNIKWDVREIGSAVPEPATWAMMILGFGIVGATMRRRSPAFRMQQV